MAKILLATSGLTGILNASFELASRLESAGHQVDLAAPRERGDRVGKEGFSFHRLPEMIKRQSLPIPKYNGPLSKMKGWWHRLTNWKKRQRDAVDEIVPRAFLDLIEEENYDLLILDVELHEYIICSYGKGYNIVLLSQWYSLWDRPDLPYLLHQTIPGVGPAGSPEAIEQAWSEVTRIRKQTAKRLKRSSLGTDRRSVLENLAQRYEFPVRMMQKNFWPGPITYSELPVLAMAPFEMEFPHDPRPKLHYLGPMVYQQRQERLEESLNGFSLTEILRIRKTKNASLILCTVSTMSAGDLDFLQRVAQAVKRHPDWILIIGLGGKISTEDLDVSAENVFPFAYVPQLKVLNEADLSINHAGIHTIHECIHFGVPMLVYSGKKSDQNGCAARVHHHGLGLMADKDEDDTSDIEKKIERVLNEASFRQKTREMQRVAQNYKDQKVAKKAVENLLQL